MANQAVHKFLDAVKADKSFESELRTSMLSAGSPKAALENAIELAKGRGFPITAEELKSQLPAISLPAASMNGALSEAELGSVTGGLMNWAKACIGSESVYCYICAMGTTG